MRESLVIVLVIFCCTISNAQPEISPRLYSRQDTVRAVLRLFDAKRTGGKAYTSLGITTTLAGALAGFVGGLLTSAITHDKDIVFRATLTGSSIGLLATGIGITKQIRFGQHREMVILDAFESGNPLPKGILRKLKARYFLAPTYGTYDSSTVNEPSGTSVTDLAEAGITAHCPMLSGTLSPSV